MIYKSILDENYYEQLENMLFFNSQQNRYIDEIINSVTKFGTPRIVKNGNRIMIELDHFSDVQNMFVFDDEEKSLIGLVLYYRESISTVTLLHIAINDLFNSLNYPNDLVVPKIILELHSRLKLIKGIEFMKILYSDRINIFRLK